MTMPPDPRWLGAWPSDATGTIKRARALVEPLDILTGLPTHTDHVGGRLAFGPDRKLYLTIGDQGSNFGGNRCDANHAQTLPTAAQVRAKDWSAYQGKILRLDLDGSIPADNPEIGGVRSHVFSVGHRNPLGLAFGPNGRLYESEHGPSSDDEANLIESGRNYGWPNVAGYKDGKAYVYANWSASSPTPCASLPRGGGDAIPPSVPQQPESAFNHPQFTPPLRTFFTVETGYDLSRIGSATIAPGGVDVYTGDGIPGWKNSLLVLSLIRGAVYRLSLAPDGRSIQGPPSELFKSANRYRDIALNPDGRTLYLATDLSGPSRDAAGVRDAEARKSREHPRVQVRKLAASTVLPTALHEPGRGYSKEARSASQRLSRLCSHVTCVPRTSSKTHSARS